VPLIILFLVHIVTIYNCAVSFSPPFLSHSFITCIHFHYITLFFPYITFLSNYIVTHHFSSSQYYTFDLHSTSLNFLPLLLNSLVSVPFLYHFSSLLFSHVLLGRISLSYLYLFSTVVIVTQSWSKLCQSQYLFSKYFVFN
jgi:hypothetical protein